jgi:hypothetical protein
MCIPQGKSTGYDVGIGSKKRRKRERGKEEKKTERDIRKQNVPFYTKRKEIDLVFLKFRTSICSLSLVNDNVVL